MFNQPPCYEVSIAYRRVLRRIFGPKRYEVIGGWRGLLDEKLRDLYSSSIIRMIKAKRMRWAEDVARTRYKRNAYRSLMGKPEGKITLGRPRHC
jgi:hypothetical protein